MLRSRPHRNTQFLSGSYAKVPTLQSETQAAGAKREWSDKYSSFYPIIIQRFNEGTHMAVRSRKHSWALGYNHFFTFYGHLEKLFMIAFAYKRIGIETMKYLDFKSSESEERNHQIPKS